MVTYNAALLEQSGVVHYLAEVSEKHIQYHEFLNTLLLARKSFLPDIAPFSFSTGTEAHSRSIHKTDNSKSTTDSLCVR